MRTELRLGGLVLAFVLAPTLAYAQEYAEPQFGLINWTRLFGGLAFCILLSVAAIFLIKRYSGATAQARFFALRWPLRAAPDLRVIETKRISPHADLCKFVSAGREYLVILSPGGATLLRDAAAENALPPENS
jgi:hypothetical protein